ncbi:MAG: hypothetical protein JWP42_687 [Pseudomonas sp.]|nr:hypothetical protein [Pseudomonas sp.]
MKKHWDFRLPVSAAEAGNTSCLTINQAGSILGLKNLLDVVSHEISQEHDKHIHRLTFKSGETLYIKADPRTVTIRGTRINYDSDANYPLTTFLSDPAAF